MLNAATAIMTRRVGGTEEMLVASDELGVVPPDRTAGDGIAAPYPAGPCVAEIDDDDFDDDFEEDFDDDDYDDDFDDDFEEESEEGFADFDDDDFDDDLDDDDANGFGGFDDDDSDSDDDDL